MEGQAVQTHAVPPVLDRLPCFQRSSVLHLGDGDRSIIDALTVNANHVAYVRTNDAITLQLERRFDLVVIGADVLTGSDEGCRRAVMHAAIQHVERDGHLIVLHGAVQPVPAGGFWADDLRLLGSYPLTTATLSLFRRGDRTTVHDLLFEARATIARVSPRRLAERMQAADGTLVLDTRAHSDRERFGVIPGAIHVPRTVVEWRFDPANGYLHPSMRSFDQPLVLVCDCGYSSSLAAANLVRLGFANVADLIGGHTAWAAAGLPVTRPDRWHVDALGFNETGFNETGFNELP